jgi:serine protease Do
MFFGGNMAFAVPSNVVKNSAAALKEHGRVIRAWTGLRLQPLKDFERDIFYPGSGVIVGSVDDGSPAAKAGVQAGDFLLAVNDVEVNGVNREDLPAINRLLADLPLDKEALLRILRPTTVTFLDAEEPILPVRPGVEEMLDIRFTPFEKGKVEGDDFDCRQWNMTVKAINEFANPNLSFFRKEGVFIQGVKYPGNAAQAQLREGDILLTVDGKDIVSLDDLKAAYQAAVGDATREKKVRIVLMRAGMSCYAVLDWAAQYGNTGQDVVGFDEAEGFDGEDE